MQKNLSERLSCWGSGIWNYPVPRVWGRIVVLFAEEGHHPGSYDLPERPQ